MKLSIITCTYNSEKYLQECIDSVIAQNLNIDTYEHIFVDAYSTDNTKKIIEKYQKKYSNVKLLERKPKWVYNAMNEGIKESKWEYIMCLNSDDYLENNVLRDYLDFIEKTGEKDLYYWKMNRIYKWKQKYIMNNNFIKLRENLFYKFWVNCLIVHPTVLVKKSIIIELWMFDENNKIASDYWMRLKMLKTKKNFLFFEKIITNFREDIGISSQKENFKRTRKEVAYFRSLYLKNYQILINNLIDKFCDIYRNIIDFKSKYGY